MKRGMERKFSEEPDLGKRKLIRIFLAVAPYLPIFLRRLIFKPVHDRLGGHLRRIVSGAAPLDIKTLNFFRSLGIPIYEGYGLTETGPVISVNTTANWKSGSVGQPLPGVQIRIDKNSLEEKTGEILCRGGHLMLGYYQNEDLTKQVFTSDGWFKTGDVGFLDHQNFLHISGRIKSLIVLESGKKVHAEELENIYATSKLVQDVCVLGIKGKNGAEQITVVVYPSEEILQLMKENREKAAEAVVYEIEKLSEKLAKYKQPQQILLRKDPFPKTSSGKVRRHLVSEQGIS
jgi:long-chain acyl-CoA synthetase